ncbi:down syndrome cell adhesion molecule-like protein Dscam2 [Caerostris extrusa]|uniref:Down syndrome cell adhesion molecule-like protein Dscam2 n=1 Tax=Caerostris extrusa TaxID=172846 RepID=A0AAV4YA10_CAEEX|nr:down syndrome cell adhesion molecule-like protein Dscam2 [Caerostris extrusa]
MTNLHWQMMGIKDYPTYDNIQSFIYLGCLHQNLNLRRIIQINPTGSIPPRITSGRPGILIREGENAELPCTAQGYPVPQYIWYRRRKTTDSCL